MIIIFAPDDRSRDGACAVTVPCDGNVIRLSHP